MTAEERQRKAKTRKVVLMLMNGAMVSTLERWRHHILEEKQLRAKSLKVVQRIKNATLVNSCDVWAGSVRGQLALKAKLLKIGHLLKHSCFFNFFGLWSRNTMERIAVTTKSARTRSVGRQREIEIERCMRCERSSATATLATAFSFIRRCEER